MTFKLEHQHKHILRLVDRDSQPDGWTTVSEQLFDVLSKAMPEELATFEKTDEGGRAKLTTEGKNIIEAMAWL